MEDIRRAFQGILDRFAANQTRNLNVHGHFDLLARLAKPVHLGKSKIAGIRLDQLRMIRLLEILLRRGAGCLGGWNIKELRAAILDTFELKAAQYAVSALRYDLRKLRAHGLIERLPGQAPLSSDHQRAESGPAHELVAQARLRPPGRFSLHSLPSGRTSSYFSYRTGLPQS